LSPNNDDDDDDSSSPKPSLELDILLSDSGTPLPTSEVIHSPPCAESNNGEDPSLVAGFRVSGIRHRTAESCSRSRIIAACEDIRRGPMIRVCGKVVYYDVMMMPIVGGMGEKNVTYRRR
jgi:hypothetical protein